MHTWYSTNRVEGRLGVVGSGRRKDEGMAEFMLDYDSAAYQIDRPHNLLVARAVGHNKDGLKGLA